jgi:hypothetical protein
MKVLIKNQDLVILLDDFDGVRIDQAKRNPGHETTQRRVFLRAKCFEFSPSCRCQLHGSGVGLAHAWGMLWRPDAFKIRLGVSRAREMQRKEADETDSKKTTEDCHEVFLLDVEKSYFSSATRSNSDSGPGRFECR